MFSLFLNYLPDALAGECIFRIIRKHKLMYADDIVFVCPSAAELSVNKLIHFTTKY